MISNTKPLVNVSLLYELAMAVANSINIEENCTHFLQSLSECLPITYASVWGQVLFFSEKKKKTYQLYQATLDTPLTQQKIEEEHYILQQLKQIPFFTCEEGDLAFPKVVQEEKPAGKYCIIFKLGYFGFLKIYADSYNNYFESSELALLKQVIDKFATSLEAGFTYEQLKRETRARKVAQEALRKSVNKHRNLFENLFDAIVIHNRKGLIVDYNKAAEKLLGLRREHLKKANIADVVHPEEKKRALQNHRNRVKKGYFYDFEFRIITFDGQMKYVNVNSNAIYKNGKYAGAREVLRDITHQKKSELIQKDNELKFQQVINTCLDSIIIIDSEGRVIEWNDFAIHTFGYTKDEVVGTFVWNSIVPHRFRKAYFKEMNRFLNTGNSPVVNHRFEISALRKSGEEFPIELTVMPLQTAEKLFFSIFIRDITARKRSENELLKAKQAAEQARLAEQQFLANMSHEIRTPMNAVIGMTHLLYETNPDNVQREYLDALKFSGDSLLGIINNILDLSKIGAGELEFEKRSFNLAELVRSLQVSFQFKVKDKPISVVMDMDYRIENMVVGDPTKLTQILTNLLGNASKFTQQGTIGLSANLIEELDHLYNIEFLVHDTGIGIPNGKIKHIFDSFKQADAAVTRKFGGTGLGLSIVKQLVEMQGGNISVESTVGKGSIFRFNLPLENSGEKAVDQAQKLEISQQDVDKALEAVSILIVEDNFMNQKLISKILDIWKCNYEIAQNGLEGLQFSQEKKYDVVLMDVHMPEMDGCETTINIRSDEGNPNKEVPIIALTAAALLDEKKRVFESGMNDFLTKPFSPNVLKGLLRKWLNIDEQLYAKANEVTVDEVQVSKTDFSYLSEFSGGDESFIIEMIETFLNETPTALEQLKVAFKEKDFPNLQSIAHRVKPTLMMMGMAAQEKMAETIEKMIKSGDFHEEKINNLINQLYVDVCEAIPELRAKLLQLK